MGVSLGSPNHDTAMSYGSFNLLRTRVAYMLSEEWGKHYERMHELLCTYDDELIAAYNDETEGMYQASSNVEKAVINFLYMSDCEGKLIPLECAAVVAVMDGHADAWADEKRTFAYLSYQSFTLSDFHEMLQDGIETGKGVEWI